VGPNRIRSLGFRQVLTGPNYPAHKDRPRLMKQGPRWRARQQSWVHSRRRKPRSATTKARGSGRREPGACQHRPKEQMDSVRQPPSFRSERPCSMPKTAKVNGARKSVTQGADPEPHLVAIKKPPMDRAGACARALHVPAPETSRTGAPDKREDSVRCPVQRPSATSPRARG